MNGKFYVVRSLDCLPCDAKRAWAKVCFYEHIAIKPSWLLRTVLPVPCRTTGSHLRVGDVSRCLYSDGGYLTKRIRRIVAGQRIDFDIIEQTIRYAGSIGLEGGTIVLEPRGDGKCSIEMLTHYRLRVPLPAAARFFIGRVVSAMHRIVIRDMHVRLESESQGASTLRIALGQLPQR